MSLKDTLRGLRRGGNEPEEDAAASDVDEPTIFEPRADGSYDGGPDPDHDGARRYLRFGGGKVREVTGASSPEAAEAAFTSTQQVGEYTPSGRFTTQAPFERAVIYTVLDVDESGFTARRTNTATGKTEQVRYTFVPAAIA